MFSRRGFLTSASAAAAVNAAAQTRSGSRKPNFIIFLADDLGCHDIGAWGATDLKTPNIDAIAASGARFTNADREIAFRKNVPAALRAESATMHRGYYAHMGALDERFARLLGALDRARVAEDTIVVFTSDHGDMMLSQGLTTKLHTWDESIRVPFLVRYPRALGMKPRGIRTPPNSPDILPTLLALAGIPIPETIEGANYAALLRGGAERPDAATLISLPVPITEARKYGFTEYRGQRTARYTYVRSIYGPWLLYDNAADPFQMRNLIGKAEARELQSRLDRELDPRLKERKDDFLPAAEYVRRAGPGHYREVNVPVGRHTSPWGDWDSTLSS
jgi:arylsulfatase A-like enzyme